ncbi:hypothetical protein IFM89_031312 [Coptis chinensis]|uniref:Uncharacterized protein n=1 Tax=Coptis chinensis TaxID=261450 RepID=A0A835MB82_9MAGN|nr:hypothetical protein IFM89_031312 [Coptis chinensis]
MLTGAVYSDGVTKRRTSLVKSATRLTSLDILRLFHLNPALMIPPLILGNGGWLISGTPVGLHDPRFVTMAAAERRLLEAQYDEYAGTNASGSAFCRFAALTLLALFLLRHALETTSSNNEDDEDVSTFFSIFMLRAFGFLLPFYIMACAISVLQRRREIEEEARRAASEVAFVLQSGQEQGLHFTIVPGPVVTHPEPHQ